ncbi:MAG: hypothetical protein SVJ22_10690, partial [Halobacteriota archaeon]|nr:hypothetical protein [Halobacteriota archaeon]
NQYLKVNWLTSRSGVLIMSDSAEDLYKVVGDLEKSQWIRKKALDDLADMGSTDILFRIVNETVKSDWVRNQALDGLIVLKAAKELESIADNENMGSVIRKTAKNNLAKMKTDEKNSFDFLVSIDSGTKEMMEDIATKSNRTVTEVLKSYVEEGKRAQNLIQEVKRQDEEIFNLKQQISLLSDLKDFNIKLKREKGNLQEAMKKLRAETGNSSKKIALYEEALGYYKDYSGTLKNILNDIDFEFEDTLECPKCGSEVSMITGYEIKDNKIIATDGHCLNCLSR